MIKTFSVTNIGKRRKLNQDFVYTSEEPVGHLPNLFVVADGMGGHKAGDYASKLAVTTMVEEIAGSDETIPEKLLGRAIETANGKVRESAEKMPELEHFVHFIRTTERGIMPGDPELAALGKHHADAEEPTEEQDSKP